MPETSQLTSINQRRYVKSPSLSRLNKQRSIHRMTTNKLFSKVHQPHQTPKKNFNDNQISHQISKQMNEIQKILDQIRPQLQQIRDKNKQLTIMQILFDLEEKIKRKNNLLTQINNQNKQLKSTNKKGLHHNNNTLLNNSLTSGNSLYNPQQQQKTFKLAQQLKTQRQQLIKIKNTHLQKKHKLQQIKNQVLKTQLEYMQRCKKTKQKPLTYSMFKSLNEEKKKQLNNELKPGERKRYRRQTLKQMIKSNSFNMTPNKSQKNLKEIVNRKKIAEQALKTAKKKYSQEISEFHAKLEFLREEDLALVQTLRQKEVQFYTLQNKFNQSRKNYLYNLGIAKSNNPNKIFQNTLRFKGQSIYFEQQKQMRKTRKSTKFLSPQHI